MNRPLPTEAEISRALAAAVKQGLRVISYRAVPGAVEVTCEPGDKSALPLDLVNWTK